LSALSHFGELASGLLGPTLAAHQHDADLRAEIERLIGERAFTPVFQPIVRLTDGKPIAEGVETDAERLSLSGLGVEFGQGYLFGRPEPAGPCEALAR
jgi:EAL domain-containing protein (putative c-di-GMP-specific phosphodiesterase class I)